MKFLILAGGSGTRLWPLSTDEKPKQFQAFTGEDTLIQLAFNRLHFVDPNNIFISTSEKYRNLVNAQLPTVDAKNIICEPSRRDTGPGIAYAMKYIAKQSSEDDVVTIINADQLIQDEKEFKDVVVKAQQIAQLEEKLVLISVKTTSANPNLGYIRIGNQVGTNNNNLVYTLDKFVEKPNPIIAKRFHESFRYLWNTGIFTWKISTFMKQLSLHAPDLFEILTSASLPISEINYNKFKKISIDFALLEKVEPKKITVIAGDLGWSDIGTWETLFDELYRGDEINVIQGKFIIENVFDCLLINKTNKPVILNKLENKVVVKTDNNLLIADLKDSATLKRLVKSLG